MLSLVLFDISLCRLNYWLNIYKAWVTMTVLNFTNIQLSDQTGPTGTVVELFLTVIDLCHCVRLWVELSILAMHK